MSPRSAAWALFALLNLVCIITIVAGIKVALSQHASVEDWLSALHSLSSRDMIGMMLDVLVLAVPVMTIALLIKRRKRAGDPARKLR